MIVLEINLPDNFLWIANMAYIALIIGLIILIIFEKRTPLKTISWIMVVALVPVVGALFYIFFGQLYRKRKMFSRKGLKGLEKIRQLTLEQLKLIKEEASDIETAEVFNNKHVVQLLLSNSLSPVTSDNKLEILRNGHQKFKSLFEAIESASKHIHLEYYIIDDDTIGNQFRNLLIRKAKEGVEVRLIYDDVGCWSLPNSYLCSLKEAGVKLHCFMRVRLPQFTSKVNYRNHRKIAVIDGDTAFVGGINIADRYIQGISKLGEWRDTHLKIIGGAATMLQVQFMADWYFVSKEILSIKNYFKPLSRRRDRQAVQILAGGPDSDWDTINQFYFAAISAAREHIYIATPYLIPTVEVATALKIAALAKVDVRILLPETGDAIIPKWSTFSYIDELLEAGVKIYLYQPGFVHSKLIMVDSKLSSVGTANFDFRSLETNFEINAVIHDEECTLELERQFLDDLSKSEKLSLQEWEKRPKSYKVKESLSRIFSPLL
ncbi:MAG: cardiolipin synthase [Mangrovibacterium sp.]